MADTNKLTIANRDIDDPANTREVSPVELELDDLGEDEFAPKPRDFSAAIQSAADAASKTAAKVDELTQQRKAREMLEAGLKAIGEQVKQETGLTVGYSKPWLYRPKAKAAYGLWRRVIPMFVQQPETLNLGPTKLAAWLDAGEANFTITRDMMYDKLNDYAQNDLRRLLKKLGVGLALKTPITIRSVQKELIERRNAAMDLTVEKFAAEFEIRGDIVLVNGKPYAIQRGASGRRRIKRNGQWLSVDTLKEFCLGGR